MSRTLDQQVKAGRGRRQGTWQNYDIEDGLHFHKIEALAEDGNGLLWLGTQRGLCSFDGHTFTYHEELGPDFIRALCLDQNGHLWIASSVVWKFDGHKFTMFSDGLPSDYLHTLFCDRDGRLWVGTAVGVCYFDERSFVHLSQFNDQAITLNQDRQGRLYIGSPSGLHCFDGQSFTPILAQDGQAIPPLRRIAPDSGGLFWLGGIDGRLYRFDGQTLIHFPPLTAHDSELTALVEDRDGQLWIGIKSEGAFRLDGNTYTAFTTDEGLAHSYVTAIIQDRDGIFWLGTEGGLSRYNPHYWRVFTKADGLADNGTVALLKDRKGWIWIGTFKGVGWFDGKRFHRLEGTQNMPVCDLAEDQEGRLWIATLLHGAFCYDGVELHQYTTDSDLGAIYITAVLADRQGRVWFCSQGTERGLILYDGGKFNNFTEVDGLLSNMVLAVFQDRDDRIWVGSNEGLSCFDGGKFTNFTEADGLPHRTVNTICQDDEGFLWLGTEGGISRFNGQTFTNFTEADGLAYNLVLNCYVDQKGLLWASTYGGGLSCFDGQVFQVMSRNSSLPNNCVHQIIQDDDDVYWIATEAGLVRHKPLGKPPTIAIRALVADRSYGAEQSIVLPETQKLIVVQFEGFSTTTYADDLLYRYRLLEHQKDWRQTRDTQVEFQSLPVGTYIFEVQVVDQDLLYSASATLNFEIGPNPLIQSLTEALGGGQAKGFVGESPALNQVLNRLAEVAVAEVTVLIQGETGTGKGLAARLLHGLSPRKEMPFVQVNCGALPEGLVESELFGHEKGAFTGAAQRKLGKVELAEGGSLFLDEIGDLPLAAQIKLLHFLQDRCYERVGGIQTLTADARLVVATNRNLEEMVAAGTFRQDLYFRLQVFPVELPPLRQRREDIPLLANYFMQRMAEHLDKKVNGFSSEALMALKAYPWPGNVRELEHTMQRAVIICSGARIEEGDLTLVKFAGKPAPDQEVVSLEEYERRYIVRVLKEAHSIRKAAKLLALPESTLRGRMTNSATMISSSLPMPNPARPGCSRSSRRCYSTAIPTWKSPRCPPGSICASHPRKSSCPLSKPKPIAAS